jgi:hypothetical protein
MLKVTPMASSSKRIGTVALEGFSVTRPLARSRTVTDRTHTDAPVRPVWGASYWCSDASAKIVVGGSQRAVIDANSPYMYPAHMPFIKNLREEQATSQASILSPFWRFSIWALAALAEKLIALPRNAKIYISDLQEAQ